MADKTEGKQGKLYNLWLLFSFQCVAVYKNCEYPRVDTRIGGEYGPYQFEELATGIEDVNTTIYFAMSTWNPYTVVLMKATVALED